MSDSSELRERIREIALQEFAEKGFLGSSLADIAGRAGCTKQNVIYHFGRKQGLLASACERVDEQAAQVIRDYETGNLDDLLQTIVDVVAANPYGVAALLFCHDALPEDYSLTGIQELLELAAQVYAPGDDTALLRLTVAMTGIAFVLVSEALSGHSHSKPPVSPGVELSPDIAAQLLRSLVSPASETTDHHQTQEA